MLSEIMVKQGRSFVVDDAIFGSIIHHTFGYMWETPHNDGVASTELDAQKAMVPDLPLQYTHTGQGQSLCLFVR